MLGGVKVLCSVLIFGRIATTNMPAAQAQAQVHPPIAHLQTIFTAPGMRFHILDLIEMRAFCH